MSEDEVTEYFWKEKEGELLEEVAKLKSNSTSKDEAINHLNKIIGNCEYGELEYWDRVMLKLKNTMPW